MRGAQLPEGARWGCYVPKEGKKPGHTIELNFKLEPRVVVGEQLNQGKATVFQGPLVLAPDAAPPAN